MVVNAVLVVAGAGIDIDDTCEMVAVVVALHVQCNTVAVAEVVVAVVGQREVHDAAAVDVVVVFAVQTEANVALAVVMGAAGATVIAAGATVTAAGATVIAVAAVVAEVAATVAMREVVVMIRRWSCAGMTTLELLGGIGQAAIHIDDTAAAFDTAAHCSVYCHS